MFNLGFLWLALSIDRNHRHIEIKRPTASASWRRRCWWSALTACAIFALTRAMSTIPVGVAYSLWCGFGIVGVTICSMIPYKQNRISGYSRHGADHLRRHHYPASSSISPACAFIDCGEGADNPHSIKPLLGNKNKNHCLLINNAKRRRASNLYSAYR